MCPEFQLSYYPVIQSHEVPLKLLKISLLTTLKNKHQQYHHIGDLNLYATNPRVDPWGRLPVTCLEILRG